MKNKKLIMFFSALLILIFHFWINIVERTSTFYDIETFIRQICFIGVDIFFFLSSYSISKSNIENYKEYVIVRFKKVYILFIIFSLIATFYFKWDLKTFILTINGLNLFIKGGGSFLWFVPAIMIVYMLLPLFNKINNKYKGVIIFDLWLLLTIIISLNSSYSQVLIFTNRIPIILIGCYLSKNNIIDKLSKKKYLLIMSFLLIIGILLLYNFKDINIIYIKDLFYLTAIPFTLGLILLLDLIPQNKIINTLGNVTLEMYGIQMIFGYKIATIIFKLFKNPLISNIITIIIIILLSLSINYFINLVLLKKEGK